MSPEDSAKKVDESNVVPDVSNKAAIMTPNTPPTAEEQKLRELLAEYQLPALNSEDQAAAIDLLKNPDKEKGLTAAIEWLKARGKKETPNHDKTLVIEDESQKLHAVANRLALTSVAGKDVSPRNYKDSMSETRYGFETTVIGERIYYVESAIERLKKVGEDHLIKIGDVGGVLGLAIFKDKVRRKARMSEIARNISDFDLNKYFEVKKHNGDVNAIAEDCTDIQNGAYLSDLLRLKSDEPFLKALDHQQAIAMTVRTLEDLHTKTNRGFGELLTNDVVLQVKDGKMTGVRFGLPDMVYDEEIQPVEQKARDLLDFLMSVGSSGLQQNDTNDDTESAKKNIQTALISYQDGEVKGKVKELVTAGYPTPSYFDYNYGRYGFDRVTNREQNFEKIKELIKEAA